MSLKHAFSHLSLLLKPTRLEGREAKDYYLHFSHREAAVNRLQTIAGPASGSPETPPPRTSAAKSWDSSLTQLCEAAFPIGKTSILGLQVFRRPPKKTRKSILPCRLLTPRQQPRALGQRSRFTPKAHGPEIARSPVVAVSGWPRRLPVPYPRVATDPLSTC